MDILEKLFGNPIRARLLRTFIYNPEEIFIPKLLAKKLKVSFASTNREVKLFKKLGIIKLRHAHDSKGKKLSGIGLNQNFQYLFALRDFLMSISPITENAMAKKLGEKGKAKLVVISGMFLDNKDARADMLIVSEKQNDRMIQKTIADIGTEFGREVSYALFTKDDFSYRLGMGDKLIRDIFDFPHKVILDKLGLAK